MSGKNEDPRGCEQARTGWGFNWKGVITGWNFRRNELEPKKKSKFKKLSLDCFSQGPPHKNLNRDNSIFPWEMIKSTAMNEKKPRRKRIRRPLLIGICLICFIALIVVVVVAARATTSGTTGDMAFGKNRHAYLISGPLANWCPNYDRKEVAPGTFQVRLDVSHIQKFVLDQTVYLHLIAAMTLDLGPQRGEYNSSHSVFLAFIIPIRGAAMVFVLDYSSKTLKKLAIKANPAQFAASIGERLPREPQGTPFLRNDGQRGLIGVRFNMDYRERLLHVWVCPGNFKEFTNECTIRTEYKVLPPKVRDPMHASFYTVFGVLGPDTTGKKGCVAFDINVKRVFEHYGCELLQEQNLGRYARICHDAAGNPYQCSENVPYKNLTKKK
ncbi:hypothetical protein BIW11_08933 [Tropilaelaps mercedesae]|uniref:Uncharacterized protein n=1 Tax=Tropilaelaps mercedesae TaxID=418985 RepID=A0A1V9XMC3_9ACAR|nr:hypothetical protein BIW11_08933 [Tropilaelaps mercedesae]